MRKLFFVIGVNFLFLQILSCDKTKMNISRVEFGVPINYKNLLISKERIKKNDPVLKYAFEKLIEDAKEELKKEPYTVVTKKRLPKSGNKHDYYSMGTYWWPNPKTKDGLPYIRKDGMVNPDAIANTDRPAFEKMESGVKKLCLAYFLTDDEMYAAHAAKLLKTWFLDDDTKMNPNLIHAQAIPGICAGRGIGLIDTHSLPKTLELTFLLKNSDSWAKEDQDGLQKWVRDYLNWFLTSENGKRESIEGNNHGTYYDAQVLGYAYFLSDLDLIQEYVAKAKDRFTTQINEKGQQTHEINRTLSFTYSCFNMRAFIHICEYSELVGVDYWDLKGKGSLKKAVNYLLENAPPDNMKKWPHKQISKEKWNKQYYRVMLHVLGEKLKEERFLKASSILAEEDKVRDKIYHLLYPPHE